MWKIKVVKANALAPYRTWYVPGYGCLSWPALSSLWAWEQSDKCQTGQEYRRYLNGVVGVRELRVRKNNLKGSALPYGITPGQHTEHISKAVVPQDAGWVCMGEKWVECMVGNEVFGHAAERMSAASVRRWPWNSHHRTKATGHTLAGWWEYENRVRDRRIKPTARRGLDADSPAVYWNAQ